MSKRDIKAKRWGKRGMKRLFGKNWCYFWYKEQLDAGKKLPAWLYVKCGIVRDPVTNEWVDNIVCRLDFGFRCR